MPTLVEYLPALHGDVAAISAPASGSIPGISHSEKAERNGGQLLTTILTTSICLHLLIVGYLGFGVPAVVSRPHVVHTAPPPPPIIENVQLEAPPPPPKAAPEVLRDQPPPDQDLPAPTLAVAAVPANVAVAFAIKVVGPVRLVSDASEASGTALAAPPAVPREVVGRSLLTDTVVYPALALFKHLTGRVVVEFHTTPTGDIVAARIRSSSGYDVLDQAALENLRLGRWVGDAGYFTKTYDFVLR
jgi:periplasmic protein TonB